MRRVLNRIADPIMVIAPDGALQFFSIPLPGYGLLLSRRSRFVVGLIHRFAIRLCCRLHNPVAGNSDKNCEGEVPLAATR